MNSDQAFDVIEHIREASGNAKKLLLNENLIPYLKAAYDPYKQYYANRKEEEVCSSPNGDRVFDNDVWWLLDSLAIRRFTGLEAQRMIDEEMNSMTRKSAQLFARILNKDLRMGLAAKSINNVYPDLIPVHAIMLAKLFDSKRVKYPCWGSIKEDGVRGVFRKGRFYSRGGHIYEGLEVLEEELKDFTEPIDGELTVPDVSFQVGSGMIRSLDPTPDAVFHILELPSFKCSFPARINMMKDLYDFGPHVRVIEHVPLANETELNEFYGWCRSIGKEGAVIKSFDYQYCNSRSYHWMKMKPKMRDLELKVIKLLEGDGKYRGMLGAAMVEYHGSKGRREVKVGSGFTDQQREDYWKMPSILSYRYIQAEAMEETDDGSLRHPVFKEIKE